MPTRTPDITLTQDSGAQWPVYDSPVHRDGFTILTGAGVELFEDQRDQLGELIMRYKAAEIGSTALHCLGLDAGMRTELGRGNEATVFSMGKFAVREQPGVIGFHAAVSQLQRMDAINDVIDHGLPRWLHLPAHYALHVDPEAQKTYTLMDRVNGGVTAEDIANYPEVVPTKQRAVRAAFGNGIQKAKRDIPGLFDRAYEALANALRESGREPTNYLTDWEPRNAIVEPLLTPVAHSRYRLSVIDQYRS